MGQGINRVVGLCLCFLPFWLNCVAQNSIVEEGSRVSSVELELRFSEILTPIESATVSS